jgi:hypothetical protein
MEKILDVNWFIKLPITLRELFVSPDDYIELPIGPEGQGSRLILRVGRVGQKFSRNSVIFCAQNQSSFCSISCRKSMLCVPYFQHGLPSSGENAPQIRASFCGKYSREDCVFC